MQVMHSKVAGRGLVTRRVQPVRLTVRNVHNAWPVTASKRQQKCLLRATEEAATASTSEPDASDSAATSSDNEESSATVSPLDRAKLAMQHDSVDKVALEAALADLEAELKSTQERAAAAETRATSAESAGSSAKDQLLRLTADFENFRRRTASEKDALRDSVRGDIVTSLLPVIDNFELARTQVKAETEAEIKINNSYQAMYKQFVDWLRSLGVEAVPSEGTVFDPNMHEAIMQEVDNGVPEGTIIQEFRKGFKLGDKLLRPAMVKVSTNEGAPQMSSEE